MPRSDFFARLGLFTIREFLNLETCGRLLTEAQAAARRQATVIQKTDGAKIDEGVRRTRYAIVSEETTAFLRDRLLAIESDIANHFHVSLSGCEPPDFLIYEPGDFFLAHTDRGKEAAPKYEGILRRRVSVVLFLNGEQSGPGTSGYSGGALTFYGLLKDPRAKELGLSLVGEPGLLVAFPADMVHAVTTVTSGERYTVVSWFTD